MKDCNQCGKCCIKYGGGDLNASSDEIDFWEINHPEIFKYVKGDEIWFDPTSGTRLTRCPFLKEVPDTNTQMPSKFTCSIYANRPEDCRTYPSLISEMIRDECEMIEAADSASPMLAQQRLNRLMDR